MALKLLKKHWVKQRGSEPRGAFRMLVISEPETLKHVVMQTMDVGEKRHELLRLCDLLAVDAGVMADDTCRALGLPDGATYSAGSKRARKRISEK